MGYMLFSAYIYEERIGADGFVKSGNNLKSIIMSGNDILKTRRRGQHHSAWMYHVAEWDGQSMKKVMAAYDNGDGFNLDDSLEYIKPTAPALASMLEEMRPLILFDVSYEADPYRGAMA